MLASVKRDGSKYMLPAKRKKCAAHVLTDARPSASSARRSMILSSISRGRIKLVDMRM